MGRFAGMKYGGIGTDPFMAGGAISTAQKQITTTMTTGSCAKSITHVLTGFENGVSQQDCFKAIHNRYDEYSEHGWCHTLSNAAIVAASLLYGNGRFGHSICMAVEAGFDTDCNGATVGSVLGMAKGIGSIDGSWTEPIHDTLHTSIFGVGTVRISDRVKRTLSHIS